MNENSPICASADGTVSTVFNGYPRTARTNATISGLAMTTTPRAASDQPRVLEQRCRDSRSMPTETKNSTANASRIGSASLAARRL